MRFCLIFFLTFSALQQADCSLAKDKSRIIVAGGSLTEIVFFLEEQKNLVAVDITSNYPAQATTLPSIGYVRALSTEGVLSLNPTLILGEEDMGPSLVVDQIESTGVDLRVIEENYTLQTIKNKISCIASILDIQDKSRSIIDLKLKDKINNLQRLSEKNQPNNLKVMIILGMDGTSPTIAGLNTSGNGFIEMTGGINIMNSFDGWKPVSAESILVANPDLIIITNRGLSNFGTLDELAKHPSLSFTNAALNNNLMAIDGMSLLGFGPRTIDVANNVAKKLQSIK